MKLQNKDYNSYFWYISTVAGQTASWKRRFLLKKSCHCRVDMVVRMRKVMAMKRSLYVCFSAGNWYCYKVVTIAKKFTWSCTCYKVRLSVDNFKKPTQPGWARPTSSPGLFPQKMGGPHPIFEEKPSGRGWGTTWLCNTSFQAPNTS